MIRTVRRRMRPARNIAMFTAAELLFIAVVTMILLVTIAAVLS